MMTEKTLESTVESFNAPYVERVQALLACPRLQEAFDLIDADADLAMAEQVELSEIESPSFEEQARAEAFAQKMRQLGLTDIIVDEVGNVIVRRPGLEATAPVIALGAHLDSVFPRGTDVKVKFEAPNIYRGPGIGDNCTGLRVLLQLARTMQQMSLQTKGDILFVGTVGEEGLGDIRGAKHFVATQKVDAFIAVDSSDVKRILVGATGSKRWRITVTGPGGHSYASFGKIPSAIHAICRAGAQFANLKVPEDPKTTFTIGKIEGGTSVNSIAAQCHVDVDMRSVSAQELGKLEQQVLAIFEKAVQEENAFWGVTGSAQALQMSLTPLGDRPAGSRPLDCPVIQAAFAAQKALNIGPTRFAYASTDANAPMSRGIPSTTLASGGIGAREHSLDEYFIKDETYQLGPKLILLTILALSGTASKDALLPKLKSA